MVLEQKGELVSSLPTVLRQQSVAGGEIIHRRDIGRRSLGALACNEVQFGDPLALFPQVNQRGATVELVHNFENMLFELRRRRL